MRMTHVAQTSIFEHYSQHQFGARLKALSERLDRHPEALSLISEDLLVPTAQKVGRIGLSVESVFRCLLLKLHLGQSYEQLAFHLSDSQTYRTFARLPAHIFPSRSGLQATIRQVRPETLEKVHVLLSQAWQHEGVLSLEKIRIDSTVVASNIAPPSDSQLLSDGIRVLSRLLAKSHDRVGLKLRFVDQRKRSKSLAFRIFNAKNSDKKVLYPELIKVARRILKQVDSGLARVEHRVKNDRNSHKWIGELKHYRDLTLKVIDQAERRVIQGENVPSTEKLSASSSHTRTSLSKGIVRLSTVIKST